VDRFSAHDPPGNGVVFDPMRMLTVPADAVNVHVALRPKPGNTPRAWASPSKNGAKSCLGGCRRHVACRE
jgi:hypothetical protein